jgi:hypothetical protein
MARKQHAYHFIYKTVNTINGKFYLGMHSTSNLEDGYLGSGSMLSKSIKKYGRENFTIEILEFCESREKLRLREYEVITQDVIDDPMCMNIRLGGYNGIGTYGKKLKKREYKPLSESHKASLRKAMKGIAGKYERTTEIREKAANTLKDQKQSEETKKKRSDSIKKFWQENPEAKVKKKETTLKGWETRRKRQAMAKTNIE